MTMIQTNVNNIINRLSNENLLTTEQARAYSQSIRLEWGSIPLVSWNTQSTLDQYKDALTLIEAGFFNLNSEDYLNAKKAFKRAAELLDWISTSSFEILDKTQLTLLSSGCYHLASLPAMASGIVLKNSDSLASSKALASFFSSDFNEVLSFVLEYFQNGLDSTGEMDTNKAIEIELLRSLGLLSSFYRTGSSYRVDLLEQKLEANKSFTTLVSPSTNAILFKVFHEVFKRNKASSSWETLNPLNDHLNEEGKLALNKFSKISTYLKRPILWDIQKQGVRKLLNTDSFALCTPTGSGKTLIAELAILLSLFEQNENTEVALAPLVLYIVPSRALASEVEFKLSNAFNNLNRNVLVTGLYGGSEWSISQAWLTSDKSTLLISTVEKAEAILRHLGPIFLLRLKCIVVDEAHQVLCESSAENLNDVISLENRSLKLESFISRVASVRPETRVIALSAVAGGSENYIAQWVSKDSSESATSSRVRTTRQMIGALDCSPAGSSNIVLDLLNGEQLELADRDSEAYIPNPFGNMPRVTGNHKDPNNYGSCHALWGAIKLARVNKNSLISVTQRIYDLLKRYQNLFEQQRNWRENCPDFFTPPTSSLELEIYNRCLSACHDYCGANSYELYFLRKGIAVHHGQLPVKVRRLMTEVIKKGITPIVVATSTLTEGVNLPFDVIFLPSIVRYNGSTTELIPISEISNLAGRAGRPGTNGEGIILITKSTAPTSRPGTQARRDQTYQIQRANSNYQLMKLSLINSSHSTATPNNSPLKLLLDELFRLWNSIVPNSDLNAFCSWLESTTLENYENQEFDNAMDSLDHYLISAIEEINSISISERSEADIEEYISEVWNSTYAKYLTSNNNLERILGARSKAIINGLIGDENQTRLYYQMGLPPKRCNLILSNSQTVENKLHEFSNYFELDFVERASLFRSLIEVVSQTPGFKVVLDNPSWIEILGWWLKVPNSQQPNSENINTWLKFASNTFDTNVNISLSTIFAHIWNRANNGDFTVPDLDTWKDVTGMSWAAFWLRELLSWGTTEPFIAFLLSMGEVDTRIEALEIKNDYDSWIINQGDITGDEVFNPKNFHKWKRETNPTQVMSRNDLSIIEGITYLRDFSETNLNHFIVYPKRVEDVLHWFDPAGYKLATSPIVNNWKDSYFKSFDFVLEISTSKIICTRLI